MTKRCKYDWSFNFVQFTQCHRRTELVKHCIIWYSFQCVLYWLQLPLNLMHMIKECLNASRLYEESTSSTARGFFTLISSLSTSCLPILRMTTISALLTLVLLNSWMTTVNTASWRCAEHWSTWVLRSWTANMPPELQVNLTFQIYYKRSSFSILLNTI